MPKFKYVVRPAYPHRKIKYDYDLDKNIVYIDFDDAHSYTVIIPDLKDIDISAIPGESAGEKCKLFGMISNKVQLYYTIPNDSVMRKKKFAKIDGESISNIVEFSNTNSNEILDSNESFIRERVRDVFKCLRKYGIRWPSKPTFEKFEPDDYGHLAVHIDPHRYFEIDI